MTTTCYNIDSFCFHSCVAGYPLTCICLEAYLGATARSVVYVNAMLKFSLESS